MFFRLKIKSELKNKKPLNCPKYKGFSKVYDWSWWRDLNPGTPPYEEMTDDELDRQYEELKRQREERRKRRKEKDFEM